MVPFLHTLETSHRFHGNLPQELAHLQRLRLIDIANNNFTGAIPSFLNLLVDLRILHLWSNQFSGKIPSSLSNLTKLEVLRIAGNFLEGEIPRELGDLHYMTALNLESNHLTGGSMPPSIYITLQHCESLLFPTIILQVSFQQLYVTIFQTWKGFSSQKTS